MPRSTSLMMRIEHPAADRVPLTRRRDRAIGAERFAQDHQLLIHRPTTTSAYDRDLTVHTITHTTCHQGTRSRRSHILAHQRSSQRAVISTPEQLSARRSSGHDFILTSLNASAYLFRNGSIRIRSEEHTSELQSLMRISYDVFCL